MGDPLFSQGFDLGVVLFVLLKALLGFGFVLVGVIFMIWFERKFLADFQNRGWLRLEQRSVVLVDLERLDRRAH